MADWHQIPGMLAGASQRTVEGLCLETKLADPAKTRHVMPP